MATSNSATATPSAIRDAGMPRSCNENASATIRTPAAVSG